MPAPSVFSVAQNYSYLKSWLATEGTESYRKSSKLGELCKSRKRVRYSGRKDDRTPNAPFAPDGEMWSSVQEWWNNNKQSIQQFFQLYGEGVATSSAFALFMLSKEQKSSGNTDDTNSNNSKKPITTLDYKGSGQVGTVSIITSNIEAQANFWNQFEGRLHHWYGKYGKTELSKANSLFHSDISVGKDRNGANDWYGPNTDFTVVRVGTMNGYGGFVEIGVGNDQVVLMGHFTEINEKVYNASTTGQKLPAGTFLGRTSFTIGSSTGPHLHVIGHDSRGLVHRDIVLNWLSGL